MEEAPDLALRPAGLSDKTKGIVVGAAGALALAGIVYAIVQEEKPKPKAKHAPYPSTEEAEVEVVETEDEDGRVKITTILKDVSTVGMAARGLAALEPIAEMLIALL
jgi:hypothetical protein